MQDERKRKRLRGARIDGPELVIEWGDGETTRHALEALRHNCPCATTAPAPTAGKLATTVARRCRETS